MTEKKRVEIKTKQVFFADHQPRSKLLYNMLLSNILDKNEQQQRRNGQCRDKKTN